MKYILVAILFPLIPMAALGAEIVNTCQLGNSPTHVIQITREQEFSKSYIYRFRYDGKSQYFYNAPDTSRGLSVHLACIGQEYHALVAYGEFTSNFLQGFVITRSPQTGQLHRLDFAERSPPQWIYIGKHETLAIMPTHGRGEYGDKKYIVYRRANRDGAEADVSGADILPLSDGYEVAQLRRGPAQRRPAHRRPVSAGTCRDHQVRMAARPPAWRTCRRYRDRNVTRREAVCRS